MGSRTVIIICSIKFCLFCLLDWCLGILSFCRCSIKLRVLCLQPGDFVCYDSVDMAPRSEQDLTHWGRDKMAANSLTTISNAFSWIKIYKCRLRFHWSLFSRVQLTIFLHRFRWWLGAAHQLSQWWPTLLTYICVTRPQWVNTLRPRQNGCHFADDISKCIFFDLSFNSNFTEVCSRGPSW